MVNKKCWHEIFELLIEHDSLMIRDFILLLTPMGFSKEVIIDALNQLIESPLARFEADEFKLNI